jgi:hypothetical protein
MACKGGIIMGFHFRKSIKIGKLFKFNKNKKGGSVSIEGPKIAGKKVKVTVNNKKKATVSLQGTGISYDTDLNDLSGKKKKTDKK